MAKLEQSDTPTRAETSNGRISHRDLPPTGRFRLPMWLPGLLFCMGGMALSVVLAAFIPTVSPLLVAIILGAVVANVSPIPASLAPGIAIASKRVLRIGIVLLGLKISLQDIAGLGIGVIAVVVAVVTLGLLATVWIGKMMGVPRAQRLLIGCGFSICGAAAVAAVDGVTDSKDEDVATAVALVVLFGTIMIPVVPLLTTAMGLTENQGGLWAGASIHEVAQVVAAGGTIGSGALATAVIVKLARVVMLAPVMTVVGLQARRAGTQAVDGKRPPLVPLFVVGFVIMVLVASTGLVPTPVQGVLESAQTWCLAIAMFGLGLGVKVKDMIKVGLKPVVLGVISTVIVASIALGGVLLVA